MTAPHVPVLVVGAGPTGLTVATLLAQRGVECLLLDRWASIYPQPRAVHLDDEVYRILARLGLREEFAAISWPCHGLRLVDPSMRVLAELRRAGGTGRHGFPEATMFDQPELERLLRANLERHHTATLRGDIEVTRVTQDGAGPVRVDYTDRVSGAQGSVLADHVLGCDGANSLVRAAIGATMQDLHFEQRWLVVDVATDAELDEWEGVHQVCDPYRAATYMRIGRHRYRWEFQLRPHETVEDYRHIDQLHPLLRPWTRDIPSDALHVVRAAEYTFRAQLADHWRDRRVFLLGDAAHLTPPFVGQGLCAGIRDAANLAWKLAAVLDGSLPEQVLDSYEAERKPHARAMIRLAKLIGTAMTQGGDAGTLLRRIVVPRLARIPGLSRIVLDSETPPLHRSALVLGPRLRLRRRRLAGRLCPNGRFGDGRRLDEVTGGRFALVTIGPASPTVTAEARRRGGVCFAAPADSDLHRWLRRGRARAAVVRPDGTVLHAGRDPSGLCAALPHHGHEEES
ncbi:bifunctional 3-(3-hydroxy-phenyl)propionate/3-hydroxycinnamic acid hydroxylase [Actinomycetospora straminea]|uniref:Bifunctional 3-(3-hydroxy-phenyl)propionate/3-hydroxycinnamic acid hydroxylase n=1 Tax=Actinomycetospora straminea TaxID=663607 RepID=A0ABP9ESE2_9PSEU|nr:bifunctional 3-(3-hydroxy-phenyl)propionate/3-hydroxycinnamic acid hydroxylase [Actinomycetospora straminea]MDD7931463.1 bifunctional 3-(3-hydroxy-phenyl)propionate/3-hydroxycinnamic acid hydroxylase [Actinomycetospora straminea]